jgi:hypothetical protein
MNSRIGGFRLMFAAVIGGIILLAAVGASAVEPYPIGKIAIIVDNRIYNGIQTKLNSYVNTLVSVEGMSPNNIYINTEFDMSVPIYDIRSRLQQYYTANGIEGAILVGAIPIATTEQDLVDEYGNITGHEENSVDYFYMDLTNASGQLWTGKDPWVDNQIVPPWIPNSFESYTGDGHAEIWISRIMCNNFTEFRRLGETELRNPHQDQNSEVLIINDYLQRAIDRMTTAASVPRRGFLMGDNGDSPGGAFGINYGNLNLPYFTKIGNPDDMAANWVNYLRQSGDQAWEWAVISEHSCAHHSNFQQNHQPRDPAAGTFGSSGRLDPPYYSYVDMTLNGGAPSQPVFYDSHGCNNADISKDDCLVEMYAMGHHGLIALGKAIAAGCEDRGPYYAVLGQGQNFGKAFLQWINSAEAGSGKIYFHLIGAGTLRAREYMPYPNSAAQIHVDEILHSYHFKERTLHWEWGFYTSAFFASISCPSSSFMPELATYNWDIFSNPYSVNPVPAIFISSGDFENYQHTLEISESNFFATNAYFGFNIDDYIESARPVGPCMNISSSLHLYNINGYPSGTGRLHADDFYDQNDNFIYVAIKEPGNDVKSFTTQPAIWQTYWYVKPSLESPEWGVNWGVNGNNYQSGIMVRLMNAAGGTDANAPYVCLYQELDQTEHNTVYFQYRDYAGDHAHKQVIARYSTSPYSMDWKLILERQGTQILAFVRDENGQKTPVGVPKEIDFSQCKWMFFGSGQSNNPAIQSFSFSNASTYEINYSLLSLKENGVLKADVTNGKSGSLFVLGAEQTGSLSGLKFSNAASITSGGNVVRASSLYNKKTWLDNAANLSGGLIFRDPDGRPIVHISTGGTISVRGGILPNMVTD